MFFGVPREEGETQQSCENKVRQLVTDAIDNVSDGIDQVLRVGEAIVVKFMSLKHKKTVLAHSTSLRQQQVSVREDYSDMVRQRRRGLSVMQQSMQQNGKRASLRCDKLFTDEGVYTYDTSNNSVVRLSPSRSWAPLCTAPKMDEVMSDGDTQRLQGGRKKERMGERPPLGTSSASDLVMLDGSDAAGSSSDASDDSTTLSARGTREAHPSSSNIVQPASSATLYSHGCQEEFISGRISDRTPKGTLRGAHL